MSVDYYYSLVSDLISEERFKKEIDDKREKYGDLLDDDALAYLIVDELGRNLGNKMKIADLYDSINATIEAKIEQIGEVRVVKNHRILKMVISDDTGKCQFVLWNDEIDKAKEQLKEGKKIKIINGYVRENMYGLQVSLGKWGVLVYD